MDPNEFNKTIDDLVKEYDDHYFQEMDEKTRLHPDKLNEIKNEFITIANKVPENSRLPEFLKNAIYDKYMKKAISTLSQSNDRINDFINKVNKTCPCNACPKYVYNNKEFKLNKLPEKGCMFTYCAIDDTIDLLNDWNTILKTKKIKRGSNKSADLSIFDLDNISNKIKSNTDRAITVLTENLNNHIESNKDLISNYMDAKNKEEKISRFLPIPVVLLSILIIFLLIIIIIYFINIVNPTFTHDRYPKWLSKIMIR